MSAVIARLRRDTERYVPPIEERRVSGEPGLLTFVSFGVPFPQDPAPDVSDMLAASPEGSPWLLYIWEPLPTKAPAPPRAMPHCCYLRTVIFYHRPYIPSVGLSHWRDISGRVRSTERGFQVWDQVRTRLKQDEIVGFRGELFKVGGGRVHWQKRRWWMCHPAMREAQS
jgi:hypothetical protein